MQTNMLVEFYAFSIGNKDIVLYLNLTFVLLSTSFGDPIGCLTVSSLGLSLRNFESKSAPNGITATPPTGFWNIAKKNIQLKWIKIAYHMTITNIVILKLNRHVSTSHNLPDAKKTGQIEVVKAHISRYLDRQEIYIVMDRKVLQHRDWHCTDDAH